MLASNFSSKKSDDEDDPNVLELEEGEVDFDMRSPGGTPNYAGGGGTGLDMTIPLPTLASPRWTTTPRILLGDVFFLLLGAGLIVGVATLTWALAEYIVWVYLAISLYMGPVTLAIVTFGKFVALHRDLGRMRRHADASMWDFVQKRYVSVSFALFLALVDVCILVLIIRPALMWEVADEMAEMEDGDIPPPPSDHHHDHTAATTTTTGSGGGNLTDV